MHNDKKDGVEHMHQKIGPEQEVKPAGPGEGMEFLHGVMMHGDARPGMDHDDDHLKLTEPPGNKAGREEGPCVGMDCLHGVLMHGDETEGGDHTAEHQHDKEKLREKLGSRFSAPDVELAIHGKGNHDHIHSDENKPKIDENHKGVPSVSDPHETIHGHLNEPMKLGEARDDENEDYASWLKTSKETKNEESGGLLGFSFPFISDSLFDEIEILKRRYLPRFWGGSDGKKEVTKSNKLEKNIDVHELLSDLDMVGDTGPVKGHNHQHHPKDTGSSEGSGVQHDEG